MPRGRNYLEGLRSKEATIVDKTEEEVKREIRSEGSWGHTGGAFGASLSAVGTLHLL